MSTTATRLITLIMLLQRQPNQQASDLASQLGVSVRTVQRYIAMLDEMGIPVYAERGPYGGYSLVRGYRMPPLVFTPEEAVAVCLGTSLVREMWGQLYEDAAQGALAKLDNVLPDEQRHEVSLARRTLVATHLHRADGDVVTPWLERLRHAVRQQRTVRLVYRGRGQPGPLERRVDPYALVHRWGWWYVVGHCHLRNAVRSFRVDRVIDLTLLDGVFERPASFDVQAYLAAEPHIQPKIQVRMRFAPQAVLAALDDRAMWDSVTEEADGSAAVTFAVPNLEGAARIALSYGPQVTVLEPDELRCLLGERARAVAQIYALG